MKILASRKSLLTASQFAASVTKTHATTLPVLSHLLIQAEAPHGIDLIASNLEVQASHWCDGELEATGDDGFCIPAKLLIDILSLSAADDVEISHADNRATITLGARKLKISTLSQEEFPKLMEVKGDSFELSAEVLGTQLSRVSFATSADTEGRPLLTNVSVAFVKNDLRFIACDGRRGAVTSIPLKGSGEFMLPPMLVSIVEKFCKGSDSDVVVTCSKNAASFKFKGAEIVGRLYDGVYPNFINAIPANRPHHCTLDRETFISALKSIQTIQRDGFKGVRFEFGPNTVKLSAENPEHSGAEEVPSSACSMDPIMLPSDNLVDTLTHLQNDEVTLEFVDSLSAMVIQEPDYLNIIMPMRLS